MATGRRELSLLPAGLADDPDHAAETEKALQTLELQLRLACDAAPSRHRLQLEAERLALESRHGDLSGGPLTLALCRRYGAAVQEYTARLEAQQSCAKQLQEILALRAAMDMAARFGARQLRALRLLPSITLLLERQTEGLHAEGCKASKKPGAASEAQAVHSRYVQKSIGIRGGGPSERGAIHDWAAQYHAFMEDGLIGYAVELQYGGVDCLRQFSATLAAITRCPTTSDALAMLTASAADNARYVFVAHVQYMEDGCAGLRRVSWLLDDPALLPAHLGRCVHAIFARFSCLLELTDSCDRYQSLPCGFYAHKGAPNTEFLLDQLSPAIRRLAPVAAALNIVAPGAHPRLSEAVQAQVQAYVLERQLHMAHATAQPAGSIQGGKTSLQQVAAATAAGVRSLQQVAAATAAGVGSIQADLAGMRQALQGEMAIMRQELAAMREAVSSREAAQRQLALPQRAAEGLRQAQRGHAEPRPAASRRAASRSRRAATPVYAEPASDSEADSDGDAASEGSDDYSESPGEQQPSRRTRGSRQAPSGRAGAGAAATSASREVRLPLVRGPEDLQDPSLSFEQLAGSCRLLQLGQDSGASLVLLPDGRGLEAPLIARRAALRELGAQLPRLTRFNSSADLVVVPNPAQPSKSSCMVAYPHELWLNCHCPNNVAALKVAYEGFTGEHRKPLRDQFANLMSLVSRSAIRSGGGLVGGMQHVSCVQFRGVDDPSTATALAMHGRWTQSAAARVPVRAVDLAALASPVARERMREVQALAAAGDEPHMYAALLLLVTRSQGEEVASALQQQEYLELLVSELEMFGVDAEGRTMQYNRPLICRIDKPDGYDAWAAARAAAGGGPGAAQPAGEAGQGGEGGGAPSASLSLPDSQVHLVLGEPFAATGARLRQLPDHAQHDPDMPAARGTRGRPLKAKPKAQLSEVAS